MISLWFCIVILHVFLSEICLGGVTRVGNISLGFQGSQMNWIDQGGIFLESNNGEFNFGFTSNPKDTTLFQLVIIYSASSTVIWSANRALPVSSSDQFVFDNNGNAFLRKGKSIVWSTDTRSKGVSSMELQDTGNLVLLGNNSNIIWQSFSYPTNTLLPKQEFTEGMKLTSDPSATNLTYVLEIKSGDAFLSADFQTPQPYWSMQKDNRKIIDKTNGVVASATLSENSWRFYDKSKTLLWQFIFSQVSEMNATWVAVLGSDGFITFSDLQSGGSSGVSQTRIPANSCSTPQSCDSYYICSGNSKCHCPSVLSSRLPNCKPGNVVSSCENSKTSVELVEADNGIHYFALDFLPPFSRTDLNGCKASCLGNCSCLAMFFHDSTRNCFLLDSIGSFEASESNSGFVSYIKVLSDGGGSSSNKHSIVVVVVIVLSAVVVILCLVCVGLSCFRRKQKFLDNNTEEDIFLENISGMPIRFSYEDLKIATKNFSEKIGQGGFGSVYKGVLQDGTSIAVKKLEGIGQGKKEFRAEVSTIGSIHHHHLVRLRGFCADGSHRLLVYEYMANGSLDKWIFEKNQGESQVMLDWDTRFNIALGTAKGLAYLHQDCESKIVHCDIKPENVLLDDNFIAKVSDLGLAKLMTREQSHVFTTLRGTRGYLAPEWITNYAISEKSDVYSYGMVLLEIIGGRRSYDSNETSEKSHFPSYAFKMMDEGKVRDVIDSNMEIEEKEYERVHRAIHVSLWCIQEDRSIRPSMTKVVQMLEGLCDVPKPPTCYSLGFRHYSTIQNSEGGTSSGPSDSNDSGANLSAVRLSGPR